jgi:hypothetical protein
MPIHRGIVASGYEFPTITGGTLTDGGGTYLYRTFSSSDTLTLTNGNLDIAYLNWGGGGAGGFKNDYVYPRYWNGYYNGSNAVVAGGSGGAGSNVTTGTCTIVPQSVFITIGAGGAGISYGGSSGSANTVPLTVSSGTLNVNARGFIAGVEKGGDNIQYNGAYYTTINSLYGGSPDFPSYHVGANGAGAGGVGGAAYPMTYFGDIIYGDMGGGGGYNAGYYDGNDYDLIYFNYWPPVAGTQVSSGGTNAGAGNNSGNGGNAVANLGGGGGAGVDRGGNGGSGRFIIRYLKKDVGYVG